MQESNSTLISLSQVVTWIIVVAGWFLVNRQNNVRETRKEVRACVMDLAGSLNKLEELSVKYHTARMQDQNAAIAVRKDIMRVASSIHRLPIEQVALDLGIIALRRAITYRNFDTSRFVSQQADSQIVVGITSAIDELLDAVEAAFAKKYR